MDTYLAYARRGLNSWWRWLLTPVAAFVLWMLLVAVISFVAARARLMPADPTAEFTTPLHPVIFFTGYGLAFGALVAALVIAMRLLQRKRFVDVVGLWRWRQFWLGLAVWEEVTFSIFVVFQVNPKIFFDFLYYSNIHLFFSVVDSLVFWNISKKLNNIKRSLRKNNCHKGKFEKFQLFSIFNEFYWKFQ